MKPEVMDGVPTDTGFYFGRGEDGIWKLYVVRRTSFERPVENYLVAENVNDTWDEKEQKYFGEYKWSEEIMPPDLTND